MEWRAERPKAENVRKVSRIQLELELSIPGTDMVQTEAQFVAGREQRMLH